MLQLCTDLIDEILNVWSLSFSHNFLEFWTSVTTNYTRKIDLHLLAQLIIAVSVIHQLWLNQSYRLSFFTFISFIAWVPSKLSFIFRFCGSGENFNHNFSFAISIKSFRLKFVPLVSFRFVSFGSAVSKFWSSVT